MNYINYFKYSGKITKQLKQLASELKTPSPTREIILSISTALDFSFYVINCIRAIVDELKDKLIFY